VCPPAPFLSARRLPTPRTLARRPGWIHIPSPAPRPPGAVPEGGPRTYQPRTGPARPPGRESRPTARCGTLVAERLYDPGQEYARQRAPRSSKTRSSGNSERQSTPFDRAARGNQPIDPRVDTISKQYQVSSTQAGSPRASSTRSGEQDGSDGGGAPWES
jgi:hypothetical protein